MLACARVVACRRGFDCVPARYYRSPEPRRRLRCRRALTGGRLLIEGAHCVRATVPGRCLLASACSAPRGRQAEDAGTFMHFVERVGRVQLQRWVACARDQSAWFSAIARFLCWGSVSQLRCQRRSRRPPGSSVAAVRLERLAQPDASSPEVRPWRRPLLWMQRKLRSGVRRWRLGAVPSRGWEDCPST